MAFARSGVNPGIVDVLSKYTASSPSTEDAA
jgi:hypothetical protein